MSGFLARGDYTAPTFETATVTLDLLGGSLRLGDTGVQLNTIAGLSLNTNNTIAGGSGVDQILDYLFDLSAALLDSLLADNQITVNVQNTAGVTAQTGFTDFVQVGFDYNSAPIPEPTTLALMGIALAGLGFQRRKAA